MKLLLIAPPWLNVYGDFSAAAKLGCVAPPLGLAYLGGAIRQVGGECRIVDMEMEGISADELLKIIGEYCPDIVGITATSPVFHNATVLAAAIRPRFPKILLGIGGVHSTVIGPDVLRECEHFDFQVIGEGEFAIQEIIRAVESGKESFEGISGVIFRRGHQVIENPRRPLVDNLDSVPMPARDLLKTELYTHSIPGSRSEVYASIFTSRGCPFQCTFCSQHTMYGRRVRFHGVERVITELRQITCDLGGGHIIFMDETLTLNRSRLLEICRAIREAGLEFTWEGWTHAATIDRELLVAMRDAGLIRLSFGIESGDPEILKKIKKGVTLDQIRGAYQAASEVGIETRGSAILGHPYETRQTAWRTIRFIRNLRHCQQVFLNVACPYPGTELYECARTGQGGMTLLTEDYSQYKRYGDPVIEVNDLASKDLKRLQYLGLLYFYLTPRRMWHNLVRRAGLRAGLANGLAFLRGIVNAMIRRRR